MVLVDGARARPQRFPASTIDPYRRAAHQGDPPQALGDWDAATKSPPSTTNWEGDAILEYGVGLDDSVAFRGVFASDPRLRHPEAWSSGRARCASARPTTRRSSRSGPTAASTTSAPSAPPQHGLVLGPGRGPGVRSARARVVVAALRLPGDLPGENPHVNKRGAVLEIDEVREASKYRHAVRVRCPGLTRPGGLAVAPPKHPKAGQVFVTEYGSEGRSGRVLALSGGGSSVYLDFTELPCHAGTPQDLVNPWTLAFGPAGDSLYVATDPNHRTVHRFDAAGKLVRAERCADEAPNYARCASRSSTTLLTIVR